MKIVYKKKKWYDYIHLILAGLLLVWGLVIFWNLYLQYKIVHTRTDFKTYEDFREKVYDYYPDELPGSAEDVTYFVYTGNRDERNSVAFTVNDEDYETIANFYYQWFDEYKEGNIRTKNEEIPSDFWEDENHSFLEELQTDDLNNYQIIIYIDSMYSDRRKVKGVLGNKEKNQIIIFDCEDVYPFTEQ